MALSHQEQVIPRRRGASTPWLQALRGSSTPKLLSTVHYANRLLQRRNVIDDLEQGMRIPGLAGEPEDDEVRLAVQIVKSLEDREKTSFQKFSAEQADRYINVLSEIAHRRTRRDYAGNRERAKQLLAVLNETGNR